MAVAIEVSFFSATQKLTNEERGRVLTFVNKFLENPAHPSLSLERVQQAKSDNVWSARVSRELRVILFRDGKDCVLVYVDHHDDAYQWATSRSIARHDYTGALQIIALPTSKATGTTALPTSHQGLFAPYTDGYLHSLGVPQLWLPTIRQINTDDELIEVLQKLPQDVAERLCDVAAGRLVTPPAPISVLSAAAEHADQARNLFVVRSRDDLRPLLDAPMATWIAFLHPTQRKLAYSSFNGAVKVTGSAGTGKTVVAMHRARHLAQQGQRVLLTSYVNTLCHNLRRNLQLFCTSDELQRITIATVHTIAHTLLKEAGEAWQPVEDQQIIERLQPLLATRPCPLDAEAILVEWRDVIQAQAISSWEGYRSASRTGRGRPLTVKDRKVIWEIVEQLQHLMLKRRETDFSGLCRQALELLVTGRMRSPFDAVIVDELQDLGASELRLLAALAGKGADRLMLVGDGGQRIYATKYSLKSLGIDVRGRSHVLRLNYRTTEQIRRFADRILGDEADDLEGGRESRRGTVSLLSGPEPSRKSFPTRSEQCDFVAAQISQLLRIGRTPDDIAVFARQANLLDMIETRLKRAGVPWHRLSREEFPQAPMVSLGTMYRAKGLEFKCVFVIDASDNYLPAAAVLGKKTDAQLREDFIEQERQLLYVSVTRARDAAFVTWAGKPSRFLQARE
jgi:superfamily I DNA/RNA helicase/mRNA-degrading endonuclease RelE of RelBE toxin-antitoxin system